MKSIIALSAITVLAALALAGCGQNPGGNSTGTQSTNSTSVGGASNIVSGAGGTMGGTTNLTAINRVPDINTNIPAGTNQ